MPLELYVPDADRFLAVFSTNQVGFGPLGRYRGDPLLNGGFALPTLFEIPFSRFARFAVPLVQKNVFPHAKAALPAAKPHLQEAAPGLIYKGIDKIAEKLSGAIDNLNNKMSETLTNANAADTQVGSGRGRITKRRLVRVRHQPKRRKASAIKHLSLRHTQPFDISDAF